MDATDFVLSQLPPPPARVLEIGCGKGKLTVALAEAGYDALGIDPAAPDGPLFRRLKLDEVPEDERFDAVVAAHSLHHVTDLERGLDKVHALLRDGGVLVLDEFGWELLDEPTADWYWGQRRILAATRGETVPGDVDACIADWEAEHVGLHGYKAMRLELDRRFAERHFSWEPYLYRFLDGVATEGLERSLIDTGAIRATGFRFTGVPKQATNAGS